MRVTIRFSFMVRFMRVIVSFFMVRVRVIRVIFRFSFMVRISVLRIIVRLISMVTIRVRIRRVIVRSS